MRKSHLSKYKQTRLIELFVAGATARTSASLFGVIKTTTSFYLHRLRVLIYTHDNAAGFQEGEVEVDEGYFGGRRKVKRGRGAAGIAPVFSLLKLSCKVYVALIPAAKT